MACRRERVIRIVNLSEPYVSRQNLEHCMKNQTGIMGNIEAIFLNEDRATGLKFAYVIFANASDASIVLHALQGMRSFQIDFIGPNVPYKVYATGSRITQAKHKSELPGDGDDINMSAYARANLLRSLTRPKSSKEFQLQTNPQMQMNTSVDCHNPSKTNNITEVKRERNYDSLDHYGLRRYKSGQASTNTFPKSTSVQPKIAISKSTLVCPNKVLPNSTLVYPSTSAYSQPISIKTKHANVDADSKLSTSHTQKPLNYTQQNRMTGSYIFPSQASNSTNSRQQTSLLSSAATSVRPSRTPSGVKYSNTLFESRAASTTSNVQKPSSIIRERYSLNVHVPQVSSIQTTQTLTNRVQAKPDKNNCNIM